MKFNTPKHFTPATQLKLPGSKEYLVGANGELNGDSKQELLGRIAGLLEVASTGKVTVTETAAELRQQRRETLLAAHKANNNQDWLELGAALAGKIQEAMPREGFARLLLAEGDAPAGGLPTLRAQVRNVTAMVVGTALALAPQWVDDTQRTIPEFIIHANLLISELTIAHETTDILEEKYNEGLEAIMVEEDRFWKRMADELVGVANPLQLLVGGLTPSNLASMIELISQWSIPAGGILTGGAAVRDILVSTAFTEWLDPVSRMELVMAGRLGMIMGLPISTDFHRTPNLKVLDPDDIYVVATPEYHGSFTDRYGVQSRETDGTINGSPSRGWYMWEMLSMSIHNARSVAKGKRV